MSDEGFDRVRRELSESFHVLKARTRVLVDFKNFIAKGSALDLAIGVVIGAAFNSVVQSLVKDVLTPLISIPGAADFSDLRWCLRNGPEDTCAVGLGYGAFVTAMISFLLTAAAVFFFVVRPVNAMRGWRRGEAPKAPDTRECPECLTSIPLAATRCRACTAVIEPAS
ncbi:MAG TPA: large conductance mechanosensitive channel protein MscL [Actinomycetota bacterium]|nr:large conductance mechanosensitive channel protein MscL [Actinomycetota bacterium]